MNRTLPPDYNPFAPFAWGLAHGRTIELGPRAVIMGVLNVTPDSFSDGGVNAATDTAIARARQMHAQGAAIIDVGGESTRPGGAPVTAAEEQARVMPVIEALAGDEELVISIDTYRAETARMAVAAGAHIINDVWGFQKEPEIAAVAARSQAGCVMMHTGRERNRSRDVIADQVDFLGRSLAIAREAGIAEQAIVLDPGFGFAKDPDENIELLAFFERLHALGKPMVSGTSRKRFIGHFTGRDVGQRDIGTAATSVVARMKGAAIFRVHDVAANRDALAIADAVLSAAGILGETG